MAFSDGGGMPVAVIRRRPLPIGPTIALAFRVFARAPWRFIGLLVLPVFLGLIPTLLVALAKSASWYPAARAGALVIQYAIQLMATGAIVHGAAMVARGAPFDFEAALGVGFRRSLPVLGVSVIQVVAALIGGLLFLVPGIIVALMFAVAVPATVIDELGPIRSLQRSMEVTRGNRWRILGLGTVVALLPGLCLGAVGLAAAETNLILAIIPFAVAYVLALAVLGLTMPSVLYLQLRAIEAREEPVRLPP